MCKPIYFSPIAGMIVGNAMTGGTLALKNLYDGITDNRDRVQTLMCWELHLQMRESNMWMGLLILHFFRP